MRRLARQFRRLSLTLPILYLACFGVLAVVLPYVPRLQFAVESPVTTLVGFSPDGHTLATTEGILLLSTAEVDNDYQGEPFRFWNVAPHRNGGNAKPLAERTDRRLWWIHWDWDELPGRKRVFWECALAPDVDRRLSELFPCVTAQFNRDKPLPESADLWFSPDGQLGVYQLAEDFDEPRGTTRVYHQGTGRLLYELPKDECVMAFGPTHGVVTTLQFRSGPSKLIVHRRHAISGAEISRTEWDESPDKRCCLSPTGRWLVTDHGDLEKSNCSVYDIETKRRRLVVPDASETRFCEQDLTLVISQSGNETSAWVQIWDLETDTPTGEYRPPPDMWPTLHALSSDGEQLVVTLEGEQPTLLSKWPWLWDRLQAWGLRSNPLNVIMLNAGTGEVQARLPGGPSFGERSEPRVAFSDDGRQLAVVGADRIVRIWDLPLRRPWALIFSLAALPPLALLLLISLARRLTCRRRSMTIA